MADIKQAIEYAKQNPNTPFANELRKRIESGQMNKELEQAGIKIGRNSDSYATRLTNTVGEDINKRTDRVGEILNRRDTNVVEKGLQVFGQGAGMAANALEKTVEEIPGVKKVIGGIGSGLNWLSTSDWSPLKKLGDVIGSSKSLQEVVQLYDTDPNFRDTVDSVANTVRLAADIKGGVDTGTGLVNTGSKLSTVAKDTAIGAKNILKDSASALKNKVSPTLDPLAEAVEVTKPVLNKKQTVAAFEKAGQPGGVEQKGVLGTYSVAPDKKALEIAESVKGTVSKNNSPLDNIANVNSEITNISDNTVRPFLKNNPAIFNQKTLNAYIKNNAVPADFIKADPVLQKTYDLTRQRMMEVVAKGKNNMEGLWDSRIEFDTIAEKQLGTLDPMSEKATAIRQAVLDTRRAVNNFIAENTPNGDEIFKGNMRKLSNMYEARGNIAEQNYRLLNKNAILRWAKQNPQKWKLVKWGLGLTGGGVVLKGIAE